MLALLELPKLLEPPEPPEQLELLLLLEVVVLLEPPELPELLPVSSSSEAASTSAAVVVSSAPASPSAVLLLLALGVPQTLHARYSLSAPERCSYVHATHAHMFKSPFAALSGHSHDELLVASRCDLYWQRAGGHQLRLMQQLRLRLRRRRYLYTTAAFACAQLS